ncbi:GNAT family N-acetyltransferase [Celeribacter persicus]|uniref:RimJ/RimL family protein N-acetyltransferase n=1 Tax=Celeribacter persicus TaxID=1651082 RepID=A0A2T5HK14_9RHOB|nr:GNAT family N-acetyltransferase [Celeribacter persicus]PTQ71869.1 RimJ/RimL family protein N-acetyltransferase [Celeribacter persicus]
MTDTILTTDRLILRPYQATDAPDIVRVLNDIEVSKWLTRVPYPYSVHDANWFARRVAAKAFVFGIEYKGRIVGTIGCEGEFGYWLGRAYWGQGIMPEAAGAVLSAWFATGQDRIEAGYFAMNVRSSKVLRAMGFVETGTSRSPCLARGHEVDRIDMILTRAAFEARNGN